MKKIAVFASGAGSNTQKIIDYFRDDQSIQVALIVCNKPGAGVLAIAGKEQIPVLMTDQEKFFRGNACVDELKQAGIDLIVLAGFLWKIPAPLLAAYKGRIINIHPALLPRYGGKGMYGLHVHQAVLDNCEKESGISIHYVDEHYDHGAIIFQATCPVLPDDNPVTLAQRIQLLEYSHYPRIIAWLLQNDNGPNKKVP